MLQSEIYLAESPTSFSFLKALHVDKLLCCKIYIYIYIYKGARTIHPTIVKSPSIGRDRGSDRVSEKCVVFHIIQDPKKCDKSRYVLHIAIIDK